MEVSIMGAEEKPGRGLTVREVARRYRVCKDKVLGWIRRGELIAVNAGGNC
jgi:excisionase family DNA binding protein